MEDKDTITVHSNHEIQYITDERTGHFKLDPFNRDVKREEHAREKRVEEIKKSIHKYDSLSDQELTQRSLELHQRAKGIVRKYQGALDQALASGKTDVANKVRKQIDDEIKEQLLDDAFAIVSAAVKREKGFVLHDSQINAALVLCDENIAEMRCGGGKTIMQFLPAYFNTLTLDHHFVITPNDYLKYEGYIEAKKVFDHLGMSVGIMPENVNGKKERKLIKEESHKDIVYATSASIAHSMLLDRMAKPSERVLPSESMSASIDEIDQIVLDNARTPFVISDSDVKLSSGLEHLALAFISENFKVLNVEGLDNVKDLKDADSTRIYDSKTGKFLVDMVFDVNTRTPQMTDLGDQHLDEFMARNPIFKTLSEHDRELFVNYYIPNAITANYVMKRDVDYIVENGKIVVYNASSGRKTKSSEYSRGIQQALEAKEGLTIHTESINGDEMSILDMIRKFDKVSGCSGTVRELNDYFEERFGKCVREIPSPPSNAINEAPIYFLHKSAKQRYIYEDIIGRKYKSAYMGDNLKYQPDAPIMIVATSKEEADSLYAVLSETSLEKSVQKITADNSDEEMRVFAQSGRKGVITISTLMAGRGTDIKLGGAPTLAASAEVCAKLKATGKFDDAKLSEIRANLDSNDQTFFMDPNNEQIVTLFQQLNQKYSEDMAGEKEEVNNLGGLCVISTDFVSSERGQRQLLSRAARQSDNGTTVQFVSFEDEGFRGSSLRLDDVKKIETMLVQAGYDKDAPITPSMGKIYKECQKLIDKCRRSYDANRSASIMRSDPYYDVIQRNGDHFREERDAIYSPEYNPIDVMKVVIQRGITDTVSKYMPGNNPRTWDLEGLKDVYYGILVGEDAFQLTEEQLSQVTPEMVSSLLTERAHSLLLFDQPDKISSKALDGLMEHYFDAFSSAIAMFSADAAGLRSSAAITPQLDQEKRFSLYLDMTQDYFDQMRDGISFDFLARANGIDLMKNDTYTVQISKDTRREINSYSRTKPASNLEPNIVEQVYTTDMENSAKEAGIPFSEYIAAQEETLSTSEKQLAAQVKNYLATFDPDNAYEYSMLSSSSALSLAEACQKIPQQDFYTLYNGSRKILDRYFSWKIADAFYNSGQEKSLVLENKDKFLGKFYQYAMTQDGYHKLTEIAEFRKKLQGQPQMNISQEENIAASGLRLK